MLHTVDTGYNCPGGGVVVCLLLLFCLNLNWRYLDCPVCSLKSEVREVMSNHMSESAQTGCVSTQGYRFKTLKLIFLKSKDIDTTIIVFLIDDALICVLKESIPQHQTQSCYTMLERQRDTERHRER